MAPRMRIAPILLLFCLLLPLPICSEETGTRNICVIFADFHGGGAQPLPAWAPQVLDPRLPGSFIHYFHTMSLGRLRLSGSVAPRVYESSHDVSAYLADDQESVGEFGRFSLEIIRQADADLDFSVFDNDGPDGVPNSGDDDGVVDALFIVVASAPAQFMYRAATGVASLGFAHLADREPRVTERGYETDDLGASGVPVLIAATNGAVQQGRTRPEAVGSMCHEYGHLLGLGDLYDTDFIATESGTPADDAAGIGAWGLMGWGALGWTSEYGPAGLSAWSRMRLGWADVVEPTQLLEYVELEDVGRHGRIFKIPLTRREFFLLEYRTRSSSYYDRGVPGEGLLIWHVERTVPHVYHPARWIVDLECADGQWADAGFPLGRWEQVGGEDNLDFWAHDQEYAVAHGGNLGDATDPFDGVRYTAFTAATNPASLSKTGDASIRLEEITVAAGKVRARLRMDPPRVEVRRLQVSHPYVAAGVPVAVVFGLENVGGTVATNLRVALRGDESVLEVLNPQVALRDLAVGEASLGASISAGGYPQVRFRQDLAAPMSTWVEVEIYAGETLLTRSRVRLTGTPAHAVELQVRGDSDEPLADITVASSRTRHGVFVGAAVADAAADTSQGAAYYRTAVDTDSLGRARLSLPSGTYDFTAQPLSQSPWTRTSLSGVEVSRDTTLELMVRRGYVLSGTIRDAQGNTIHGQGLRLTAAASTSEHWYTRTVADGSYHVKVPAGHYTVVTYSHVNTGSYHPAQTLGELVITQDQTVDFQLRAGVVVTIDARDDSGREIAGLNFALVDAMEPYGRSSGRTGVAGKDSVEVIPGSYSLSFWDVPAPFLAPETRKLEVVADTTLHVSLMRGHQLTVILQDEAGLPFVPETAVSISVMNMDTDFFYSRSLFADGQSAFSLGVLDGGYHLSLSGTGIPAQSWESFWVNADTTVQLVVRLGVAVRGRVRTQDGQRVGGGHLSWQGIGDVAGGSGFAMLDADGIYQLRLLPGSYQVSAYFWDGLLPSQPLDTVTVRQDTALDWTVCSGQRVLGRVLEADGSPAGNELLMAQDRDTGISGSIRTGADGVFQLYLPSGQYTFTCLRHALTAQQAWKLGKIAIPAPTDTVRLTVPGGAELRLRLEDGAGTVLPSVVVVFAAPLDLQDLARWDSRVTSYQQSTDMHQLTLFPGHYAVLSRSLDAGFASIYALRDLRVFGETTVTLVHDPHVPTFAVQGRVRGLPTDGPLTLLFHGGDSGYLRMLAVNGGRYSTRLPRGTFRVAAWIRDGRDSVLVRYAAAVDIQGDLIHDIVLRDTPTAVRYECGTLPAALALSPNYPNPFNASTAIVFALQEQGAMGLEIYNIAGQRVRTLLSGSLPAGVQRIIWDGRDDQGRPLGSGVYILHLRSGSRALTRRMVLVK